MWTSAGSVLRAEIGGHESPLNRFAWVVSSRSRGIRPDSSPRSDTGAAISVGEDEALTRTTHPTGTAQANAGATTQQHGVRSGSRVTRIGDIDTQVEPLAARLCVESDPVAQAQLRERIIVSGLPLADAIAMRYRDRGIETDDLLQVARTALVKAVLRYRPGAGHGFCAFASPTISGEVKRWFRDHGWSVRPPRAIQELRAALTVREESLRHELGRDPDDTDLADALGVDPSEVAEARSCSAGYHAVSLDRPTATGTSLADEWLVSQCPAASYDMRDALAQAIAGLPERERLVLRLRFVDELTQSEIGLRIGVSQMQVSRILAGILKQLRCHLSEDQRGDRAA